MYVVEFLDYSFHYQMAESKSLVNINLKIEKGSFTLVCGKTGSGKSTLLRSIKSEIAPVGETSGEIKLFNGTSSYKEISYKIGFVFQNPENQIVMDSVWHELAFGLENIGTPPETIRRKIAEVVNFFGLENQLNKKVYELSGGQKQILNLASVMAMQPELLILDEPTAMLDPIASKEFLQAVKRINDEIGTTVIMSEHRLEDELLIADRVLYISDGELIIDDTPKSFVSKLYDIDLEFSHALPSAVRLARKLGERKEYPMSVRQAKNWISSKNISVLIKPSDNMRNENKQKTLVDVKQVWYRYSSDDEYVLKGVSLNIKENEIHTVVGGNGSGKSTLLGVLSGVFKLNRGKVKKPSGMRAGLLCQNPMAMFSCDSVLEELTDLSKEFSYSSYDISNIMERLNITHLKDRHPYDLSGGEMQKVAFAKLLLISPQLILLDEPTKGIDAAAKIYFMKQINELKQSGKTVIIITHDLEFAAAVSDRCSMMLDGDIVSTDNAKSFFDKNMFYTTGANRITSDMENRIVLIEDIADD